MVSEQAMHADEVQTRTKKMRIGLVTESYGIGGVERAMVTLATYINRERFELVVVCSDNPNIQPFVDDLRSLDIMVRQTALISAAERHMNPKQLLQLAKLIRDLNLDILHPSVLGGAGARYIVVAGRVAGVRIIAKTINGTVFERASAAKRYFTRAFDSLVDVIVTPSDNSRDSQIQYLGRNPRKVRRIHSGIDLSGFDPSVTPVSSLAALGRQVVGTVGRMDEQKGIPYFLEMAEILHAEWPETHFLIVGGGPEREHYQNIAREKRMEAYVTFTGQRPDVDRCLAAMDIFVLASVHEPFGLVLAEAMAMEKPVVTTAVGGAPEVIENGHTGICVPPRDGRALADAVAQYLRDPELAAAHGKAGRVRSLSCFSGQQMTRQFEALYDDLAGRRQ